MLIVPPAVETLLAYAADGDRAIYIKNIDAVRQKLATLHADGAASLHIVTDFDMTLTQYWVDGKRNRSTHGLLEGSSRMTPEWRAEILALYKKFYPIE
eukprot:jgi/Hompol1/5168/HPOL_004219-RA